jgi:hypothetical protein
MQRRSTRYLHVGLLSSLAVVAIAGPAFSILHFDMYNAKATTRALGLNWVEANVPHGSKLWLEPNSLEALPSTNYQLGGGDSVLAHPLTWYAENDFNYVVLSEATYKDLYLKGDSGYKQLIDGPLPTGLSLVKTFQHDENNQPGPTLLIISTGLPAVATSPTAFNIKQPLQLNLGPFKLLGLAMPASAKAGTKIELLLYWQTVAVPRANYTTFVHLLNAQGQIVAQLDLMPLANTRPTTTWQPGENVRDPYPLQLPATLATGQYHVHVGLYEATSGARLTTPDGRDELDLGVITVSGANAAK